MSKTTSLLKAVGMVPWFLKASWGYVGDPAEFFRGVAPACARFTIAAYKDCRSA